MVLPRSPRSHALARRSSLAAPTSARAGGGRSAGLHGVWAWASAGALLGGLWAAVQWAPARWLQQAVHQASQGRVQLSDSQGTVWQGSAQLGLGVGSGSRDAARLPGRVHWKLTPGLGQLQLALQADCCTSQPQYLTAQVGMKGWRVTLQASQSTWPAAVLAGLGTPWNTVQLQGPLQLRTQGLVLTSALDRVALEGQLQLDMPQLASRLSTLRPLGSYQLQLRGGSQPSVELRTLSGRLRLQGNGHWAHGHLRFVGEARAEPAFEAELSNLLNIMGRRQGAHSVITLG